MWRAAILKKCGLSVLITLIVLSTGLVFYPQQLAGGDLPLFEGPPLPSGPQEEYAPDQIFEQADTLEELQDKIEQNSYNFTVDHNWVYDMSPEEKEEFFSRRDRGFSQDTEASEDIGPLAGHLGRKQLPTQFDWTNHNGQSYIGDIRNQGSCGSCYAFGACTAAEGTYNWANGLYDGNCADFSESFVIWCLGSLPQYSSHFYGCYGADYTYSELTALTVEGVSSEADFPYQTSPGCGDHWDDPRVTFDSWHRILCSDIDAIKTAIMTYGPVDAAVYATAAFQAYSSGIYEDSNTDCDGVPCYYTTANHAIALVGWNDNGNPETDGYWILRNSWGSSWGENGYMRIKYRSAAVACAACYLVYTSPAAPDISVSPTSFEKTLPPDTSQDYTLDISNDGDAALSYTISDREVMGCTLAEVKPPSLPAGKIRGSGGLTEIRPSESISFPAGRAEGVEIGYDDGDADNAYAWYDAGNGFAVRFTSSQYPINLTTARFCFWPEWPDSDHEEFAVQIYDDNGPGGDPGTLLGSVTATASNWGWCDVDISSLGITITSGDFYILYKQLADHPNCEGLCFDWDDPVGRSWDYWSGGWYLWEFEDYMIRCVVEAGGEGNNIPNTPSNPSPAHQATGVSVDADLSWTGGDPDVGDTLTYDVYFDTTEATTLVSNDQSATTYDPGALQGNTKYYWKIVATDNHAASTSGPVWYFTTAAADCPWLSESPTSGSVAAGGPADSITVSIDASGLTPGDYSAEIIIANNDPDENPKTVPLTLHVTGGAAAPTVTTNAATSVEETTATLNGTLSNDGGEACQYRFEYDTDSGEPYANHTDWTGSKTTGQSFSEAISSLGKGTKYYFRAQAKNSAGTSSGTELSFLTKPDAPTSFSATTASTTQIDLSWAKGDGAQKTKIQRKEGSYPSDKDDGTEVYFDTGTSKSDTGLSPGTTYYYRAWSEVSGSQQWSDNYAEASATTTSIAAPTVTTNAATSVEETTATLNGTLSNDGGEACQYRFEYDTDSGEPYANHTDWTGSKTTGQSFSEAISSLGKGTKYYFRAQAKNSAGTSSGPELSFLTKPDAPTSFTATTASTTQIDLSWTKGDGAQKTKIQRKEGSYPSDKDDGTQVYFDTGTSKSDTGLSPDTTYYYRAWSEVSGSEQWSDNYAEASATTQAIVAPTVATNAADNIGTNSAILNGTLSDLGSASSVDVSFEWGETDSYGNETSSETKSSTGSFNFDLDSLSPNTTYHFRAKAVGNDTAYGLDRSFTTADNPPNTPSSPSPAHQATEVSLDADLSWTGGDPDTGDTVTYDVYFDTTAATTLASNDQTGTTYDPGILNNNTTYYWKIAATDNHAASTTGSVWEFTTEAEEVITITGVTGEVNCDTLAEVTITLYKNSNVKGSTTSDGSGNYTLAASISEMGEYEVVASKDGFKDKSQLIDITELGQQYELNFRAETGLIPNAPDVFYVQECVNHWLYPESPCGLSVFKVLEVVNAWLYPA